MSEQEKEIPAPFLRPHNPPFPTCMHARTLPQRVVIASTMVDPDDNRDESESVELIQTTDTPANKEKIITRKARWFTPEYLVYFAWLGFCYYHGTKLVLKLSAGQGGSHETHVSLTRVSRCRLGLDRIHSTVAC